MSARDQERKQKVSAQRRLDEHQSALSNTAIKIPEGANIIVIKKEGVRRWHVIPFTTKKDNPFCDAGLLYFERTYWCHPRIGSNEDTYVCPKKVLGLPCPVCEDRAKRAKDPSEDEDTLKALKPKERQLWNILDDDEKDKGVQIFDFSMHLFGKFLDGKINNADADDKEMYKLFADPEDGLLIRVGFTEEKGGGYTFYKGSDIEFKGRKTVIDEDILKQAYCLDDLLKVESYDTLYKIYHQLEDVEDPKGGGRDEDPPKKKTPVDDDPPPRKKAAQDDDPPPKKAAPKDDDEPPRKKAAADDEPPRRPRVDDDEPPRKKAAPPDDDAPPRKAAAQDDDPPRRAAQSDDDPPPRRPRVDDDEPPKKKKDPTAEERGITRGCFIVHDDYGTCEVIKISEDGLSLTLEDKKGDLHKGVAPAHAELYKPKKAPPEDEPPKKAPRDDDDPPPRKRRED